MIMRGPAEAPLFADSAIVILNNGPGTSAPESAIMKDETAIRKRFIICGSIAQCVEGAASMSVQ